MGLDKLFADFVAAWPALQSVWALVLSLMLSSAIAGWALAKFHSASSHELKDQRLAFAEAQTAEYKDKLEGKSPDEVKNQLENLQRQIDAMVTYGLSRESEQRAIAELTKLPQAAITINRDIAATDSERLYRQVLDLFHLARWNVWDGIIMGLNDPPASGVTLFYWSETAPEVVATVKHAFEVAGLDVRVLKDAPGTSPTRGPQVVFSSRDRAWTPAARWS